MHPVINALVHLVETLDEGFWPTVRVLNDWFRYEVGWKFAPIAISSWILYNLWWNKKYRKHN